MRYIILVLVAAGITYAAGREFKRIEARFDSLQADINLLNADVQALDYLRKPALPGSDRPVQRTDYFI